MNDLQLFDGISAENRAAMMSCFKPEQRSFRRGETIRVYAPELSSCVCWLQGGRTSTAWTATANTRCLSSTARATSSARYSPCHTPTSATPSRPTATAACCSSPLRASTAAAPKACEHHTKLTQNLFELSARKAQTLAMRINMISKKSMRRKLCAYFDYLSESAGSRSFNLEISLTQLAGYLCADRSSMMRELRCMEDCGIIRRDGRHIELL